MTIPMTTPLAIDYSLYFVVDYVVNGGYELAELTEKAISGGATFIQLRYKSASTREFLEQARKVKTVCDNNNIPFVINDRVDIALAVNADGVHLGQDDMPIEIARPILGKDKIIGITAGTVDKAIEAEQTGADYIGSNAIFPTSSKKDAGTPIGLETLKSLVAAVNIPVIAIGGINLKNARSCIDAGATGIAVISAISLADDPKTAARELKATISN